MRHALVDCDLHPTVPGMHAILPYLDAHWADMVQSRGVDSLDSVAYPPNAPLTCRPDWRGADGLPPTDAATLARVALDPSRTDIGILNCLWGVHLVFNEDMAVALARAVNDWLAAEWLARDARFRASIILPLQSVEASVAEIEHRARDPRFVQVLLPAMWDIPYGRRALWPVWEACERHNLPLAIHAGSAYRHPPTSLGWPSFTAEDYASQSQGFQSQLASLICEGAFVRFPRLRVVLLESGVSWLPAFLWRLTKFWRGVRFEIPWVDRTPAEIAREHVRLSVTPFDVPDQHIPRLLDHLGGDAMLLWGSDIPHWQQDGPPAPPPGLDLARLSANALALYARLDAEVPA